jgi:hypothetical protein
VRADRCRRLDVIVQACKGKTRIAQRSRVAAAARADLQHLRTGARAKTIDQFER